jgi:hypothetical protein
MNDTRPNKPDRSDRPGATHRGAISRLLAQLERLPDVRADKVREVREAIARGEYDDDAHLDACLARMENDVGVLCRGSAPRRQD